MHCGLWRSLASAPESQRLVGPQGCGCRSARQCRCDAKASVGGVARSTQEFRYARHMVSTSADYRFKAMWGE